jgi:cellulose synthase (UDP-forming)
VARGAAEETYPYYSVVQMAAFGTSAPVVTGCHCAHRISALRDIGGFPEHAAEDLLATVRYAAKEWKGVFVPAILARGLAPGHWADYLNQQFRWAWSVVDIKLNQLDAVAGPRRSRLLALLQGFGYIHDAVLASVSIPLFCFALATGAGQEPFLRLHSIQALALLLALWVTNRYKRRFFLDRASEGGLHWRAFLLRLGKWPRVLQAFYVAFRKRDVDYVVTPKLSHRQSRTVLLAPIGFVVLCVGVAWAVAWAQQREVPIVLQFWAAALIACGVAVIASELLERVR